MMRLIKEILGTVEKFSTMADVWTAHHRSYLGKTVRWINEKFLKGRRQPLLVFI